MTKYREILRLSSLGFSNRNIALSVPYSRNTVAKILKRAQELDISWPLEDNQTDEVLEGLFYPKQCDRSQKRMPDYDYIHKELLRNGVSKKLLLVWYEQLGGGDSPLADAIIDRIAHDSYRINITSIDAEHDRSMREVYGLDKELHE